MFKRSFKPVLSEQLNQADKKRFKEQLSEAFPLFDINAVNEVVSKKTIVTRYKLDTDESIIVYVADKQPIVFLHNGMVYPTVFLLWKYPDILSSFVVHKNVEKFLRGGADLMLRGVVATIEPGGKLNTEYGNIERNSPVYVCLVENRAAIAVGSVVKSSADLRASLQLPSSGKCVNILQVYGDALTKYHDLTSAYPNLGPPCATALPDITSDDSYDFSKDDRAISDIPGYSKDEQELASIEEVSHMTETLSMAEEGDTLKSQNLDIKSEMDELLRKCFFTALKYSKTLKLPILVSNFYKNELLPLAPTDKPLNIKQSSYPKLKHFMNEMYVIGVITVEEKSQGVQTITEINKQHDLYKSFSLEKGDRPEVRTEFKKERSILEKYTVTSNVLPIFSASGYKKGSSVSLMEVRQSVTHYIKNHSLQAEDSRFVQLDDVLKKICGTTKPLSWNDVINGVVNKMTHLLEVRYGDEQIVTKGDVPIIKMSIEIRSNKKLTVVDNLEPYGIKVSELAKETMLGVAASTNIQKNPGAKYLRLTIQGNQISFINKLLTEKYQIPKKYITGLECAPKKK